MPRRLIGVAVLSGAVAAAGCDAPWQHEMSRQPSLASTHSPREPAPGALTVAGERRIDRDTAALTLRNPLGPGEGATDRALFGTYCVPCHGIGGIGDGTVPAHFAIEIRIRPPDLTSAAVQQHTDGWFFATITNGTPNMPAYHFELTPRERWQIVRYVRQFGTAAR